MERTIKTAVIFAFQLRVLSIGLLIISLAMMTGKANGQAFQLSIQSSLLSPPSNSDALRHTVRNIYTGQIGVREKGVNSGPEVEEYLRYVKLPKGNPWCAAFVCWALGEAGVVNPRTGWSPGLFPASRIIFERGKLRGIENGKIQGFENGKWKIENDWAKREDGKAGSAKPQGLNDLPTFKPIAIGFQFSTFNSPGTGDVFGLYFPEKRRIAHVGFIDEWNDTWLTTVEGNTNILGSREGDGVYKKRRLTRSVYKVARYVN